MRPRLLALLLLAPDARSDPDPAVCEDLPEPSPPTAAAARPCGAQSVSVRLDDAVETFEDLWVQGGEDLVFVWPAEHFAVVRIVGPDCAPTDTGAAR